MRKRLLMRDVRIHKFETSTMICAPSNYQKRSSANQRIQNFYISQTKLSHPISPQPSQTPRRLHKHTKHKAAKDWLKTSPVSILVIWCIISVCFFLWQICRWKVKKHNIFFDLQIYANPSNAESALTDLRWWWSRWRFRLALRFDVLAFTILANIYIHCAQFAPSIHTHFT